MSDLRSILIGCCALVVLFVTAGIALVGCQQQPSNSDIAPEAVPAASQELVGVRVLLVVPQRDARWEVYQALREALDQEGASLTVASPEGGAVGSTGGTIEGTIAIEDVGTDEYSALVLGGGPGLAGHARDPELLEIASRFADAGKLIAAIRISQEILGNAGLLRGRKVAGASGSDARLKAAGAEVVAENVVVDGKLITARGPKQAKVFVETIIRTLSSSR